MKDQKKVPFLSLLTCRLDHVHWWQHDEVQCIVTMDHESSTAKQFVEVPAAKSWNFLFYSNLLWYHFPDDFADYLHVLAVFHTPLYFDWTWKRLTWAASSASCCVCAPAMIELCRSRPSDKLRKIPTMSRIFQLLRSFCLLRMEDEIENNFKNNMQTKKEKSLPAAMESDLSLPFR